MSTSDEPFDTFPDTPGYDSRHLDVVEEPTPIELAGRAAFEEYEAFERRPMQWEDLREDSKHAWYGVASKVIKAYKKANGE
jgi:hypothetical protein